MRTLMVAIHGILTRQTDASWPDRFDAWMSRRDSAVKVLKKEYAAGPFPRWNCLVKDPRLARGLAAELELFLSPEPKGRDAFHSVPNFAGEEGRGGTRPYRSSDSNLHSTLNPRLVLVAHSNGAVIAVLTARELLARGHRLGGLILTGAACEGDLAKNGVLQWLESGQLGAALAYCSHEDAVLGGDPGAAQGWLGKCKAWLWGRVLWPYGCLGRTGWLLRGRPLASGAELQARVVTRWFPGGHSSYFAPENLEHTFEQIYADAKRLCQSPPPCSSGRTSAPAAVLLSLSQLPSPSAPGSLDVAVWIGCLFFLVAGWNQVERFLERRSRRAPSRETPSEPLAVATLDPAVSETLCRSRHQEVSNELLRVSQELGSIRAERRAEVSELQQKLNKLDRELGELRASVESSRQQLERIDAKLDRMLTP